MAPDVWPTRNGMATRSGTLARIRLRATDIIRCLKRFVAREIYNALIADHRSRGALTSAA